MNDDVRSPGSQSTPGPLSAQPPPGLDNDPGKSIKNYSHSSKFVSTKPRLDRLELSNRQKKRFLTKEHK